MFAHERLWLPSGGLSPSFYTYIPQAEAADKAAEEVVSHLGPLPRHYRAFYGERLMHNLQRALGLEGEKGEEEG